MITAKHSAKMKTNWTTVPSAARKLARERQAKLAARKPLWKPRKRIATASTARAKQLREYAKLRKGWLVGKRCEACLLLFNRPAKEATEVHHRAGRSGKLLLDKTLWLALDAECHRYIHDHPTEARQYGLLPEKGGWNRP